MESESRDGVKSITAPLCHSSSHLSSRLVWVLPQTQAFTINLLLHVLSTDHRSFWKYPPVLAWDPPQAAVWTSAPQWFSPIGAWKYLVHHRLLHGLQRNIYPGAFKCFLSLLPFLPVVFARFLTLFSPLTSLRLCNAFAPSYVITEMLSWLRGSAVSCSGYIVESPETAQQTLNTSHRGHPCSTPPPPCHLHTINIAKDVDCPLQAKEKVTWY